MPRGRRRASGAGLARSLEWLILIAAALVIALLIKTFLFQAFYIPSESMVPTLKMNDRVLVNKLSYKLHDVHRGDIVVFKAPPGQDANIKDLVKRVIGLPGETVEFRNGHGVHQRQAARRALPPRRHAHDPVVRCRRAGHGARESLLDDGRQPHRVQGLPLFRRDHQKSDIVGRVFFRIWPLNQLGFM